MRWWLRPSKLRSRCSCTLCLASGKCRTSFIPLSRPTVVDCPVIDPTAPNTPLSVGNTNIILPEYKKLRANLPSLGEQRWYQRGTLRAGKGKLAGARGSREDSRAYCANL